MLANAVGQMQTLGWLPFSGAHLWNLEATLSEESAVGGFLHGLLGYSDNPTVLQAIAYISYLLVAGGFFLRETRKPLPAAQQPSTNAPASVPGAAS